MSAVNVQKLCESAQERLKTAVKRVETFLNEHALPQLAVDGNEESVLFYKGFLSDLRHVLVFFPKYPMKSWVWLCAVPTLTSILRKRHCITYTMTA